MIELNAKPTATQLEPQLTETMPRKAPMSSKLQNFRFKSCLSINCPITIL
jgi:hypothetical protein